MISIVILTKNEEIDLPACLESVKWCDDVHVLDSGSTDRTFEIARQHNAKWRSNPFESFGKQRNYALDQLSLTYNWVLFLDADEVVTVAFLKEIINAIKQADANTVGFYCCWKMMLNSTWLKHSDNFPKWQFRIVRNGAIRFKDFGHGQKEDETSAEIKYIKEPYLHYGFSKGWFNWMERHNRYSNLEAESRLYHCPPFSDLFSKHASTRNMALKSWLSRTPGGPLIRFFQAYIFNFGFLEGRAGFTYCVNMCYYEFLIQIKMRELKLKTPSTANQSVKNKSNDLLAVVQEAVL